jgi:uncharacterized membrane protein YdjX (TVP38/TMEM64 family)
MQVYWNKLKVFLSDRKRIIRLVQALVPLLLIYIVFLWAASQLGITKESVQTYFEGQGALLIPAFIVAQLLASLTPLPDFPFLIVGILFFKAWFAFILILFGMWLGTVINFFIARKLGRSYIKKHYPQTVEWIDKFTGDYGVETVVAARSFTFVTFDIVAYAAGVSNMKFVPFAAASVIGLIPIALNATLIGITLTTSLEEDGLSLNGILRSLALFVLTASLSLLFAWIARNYKNKLEWLMKLKKLS